MLHPRKCSLILWLFAISACAPEDDESNFHSLQDGCLPLVESAISLASCGIHSLPEEDDGFSEVHCAELGPDTFADCPDLCQEQECVTNEDGTVPQDLVANYKAVPTAGGDPIGFSLIDQDGASIKFNEWSIDADRGQYPAQILSDGTRFTIYSAFGATASSEAQSESPGAATIVCHMDFWALSGEMAPCDQRRLKGVRIRLASLCTPKEGEVTASGGAVETFDVICTGPFPP